MGSVVASALTAVPHRLTFQAREAPTNEVVSLACKRPRNSLGSRTPGHPITGAPSGDPGSGAQSYCPGGVASSQSGVRLERARRRARSATPGGPHGLPKLRPRRHPPRGLDLTRLGSEVKYGLLISSVPYPQRGLQAAWGVTPWVSPRVASSLPQDNWSTDSTKLAV